MVDAAKPEAKDPYQHVARVGIALFGLPAHNVPNRPSASSFYDRVVQWLDQDSRVSEFEPVAAGDNVVRETTFAMTIGQLDPAEEDDAHSPSGHVHVCRFERPIEFKMNIARRHQRQELGESAIPAEDYYVSWDGVQLFVMWPATNSKVDSGFFGGFAAIDLLEEALTSVELPLIVEPCGPNCKYPFAHRDLVINADATAAELAVSDRSRLAVDVAVPQEKSPLRLAAQIATRLEPSTTSYARMRAYGAAVTATNNAARRDVARLLRLQYDLARTASLKGRAWVTGKRADRGKSSKMALITANLWLELATIEENRRRWTSAKAAFDTTGRYNQQLIFAIEYAEERDNVESVDVEDLRSVTDRMTQRADSRSVGLATLVGAIAGGAVGGLIALVASLATTSGAG